MSKIPFSGLQAAHLLTLAGQKNLSSDGHKALIQTGLQADLYEAAEMGSLAAVDRRVFRKMLGLKGDVLIQLFIGEEIELDPTDGTETLASSDDVFTAGIDSDFKNWKTNCPGKPTGKTSVAVHELVQDAKFAQIFGSTVAELERNRLEQGQIKAFCWKHHDKLRADGYATLFLFKVEDLKVKDELDKYFVAFVYVLDVGRLYADVRRLSNDSVWRAGHRRRVVTPQLPL